jgi:hypothetical protein
MFEVVIILGRAYMKSQYLRAFPFQPQWETVGMYPMMLLMVFVAVVARLK